MNKSILITGVAGFIGSKIAHKLVESGFTVYGVDDLSSGSEKNIPSRVNFILGDLSDKNLYIRLPKTCKLILHLAGQSSGEISFEDPVSDLAKNTVSTLNLIKFGIESGAEKFLYASSMSVYGFTEDCSTSESHLCNPLSCYGVGKLAAENYLHVFKDSLPFTALRMFNVYGPGQDLENMKQGMVSIYLSQALTKNNFQIKGNLNRYRDFIFIEDVVDIWYRTIFSQSTINKTINLGTGVKTYVKELANLICRLDHKFTYHVSGKTAGDQFGIYADTSLLESYLGPTEFTSLEKGLEIFYSWAKLQSNINLKE